MSDTPVPFRVVDPNAPTTFRIEPFDGVEYEADGSAFTLDEVLETAKRKGGQGRVRKCGEVVGYWGDVPRDEAVAAE